MSTYSVCNPFHRGLLVAALALSLGACAGQQATREADTADDEVEQPAPSQHDEEPRFTVEQLNQRGLLGIREQDRTMFLDPDNPLSTRIVYFEFDSSRIQSRFAETLRVHAEYLKSHPDVRLRLEGHTDERGTREYNVALGERRAVSVEKALVLSGAEASRISTLSFGEEQPAALGSTEEAYADNRRVELIYVER